MIFNNLNLNDIDDFSELGATFRISELTPRFYQKLTQHTSIIIVEQPPSLRLIKYNSGVKHCALPYVVFVIYIDYKHNALMPFIYFGKERIKSLETILYRSILPNCHINGFACLGNENYYWFDSNDSLSKSIQNFFAFYWCSGFTNSLSTSFKQMAHRDKDYFGTLETWFEWSEREPLLVLERPFISSGNVRNKIKYVANWCSEIPLE